MPQKVIFENYQKISSLKKWKKKFGESQKSTKSNVKFKSQFS